MLFHYIIWYDRKTVFSQFCYIIWSIRHVRALSIDFFTVFHGNRPVAQIPQFTSHVSNNSPVCNRNLHMCALWDNSLLHCGICEMGLFACHFGCWKDYQWSLEISRNFHRSHECTAAYLQSNADEASLNLNLDQAPIKLPWIFLGAPFKVNGAPRNIQGNLGGYVNLSSLTVQ